MFHVFTKLSQCGIAGHLLISACPVTSHSHLISQLQSPVLSAAPYHQLTQYMYTSLSDTHCHTVFCHFMQDIIALLSRLITCCQPCPSLTISSCLIPGKAPTHHPDSNQQPTAFIRPLCCLLSDPFGRKVAFNTPLWCAVSSTVVCMFCACTRCNKWVAPHENRKWWEFVSFSSFFGYYFASGFSAYILTNYVAKWIFHCWCMPFYLLASTFTSL